MKLLVSARNADEVGILLKSSVDVIDLKEPNRGSLGWVDRQELDRISALTSSCNHLSVAYGELAEWHGETPAVIPGQRFAKAGLSRLGSGEQSRWQAKLSTWCDALPSQVQCVAVIYADHARCSAPSPHNVIDWAWQSQVRYVLIDTFDKTSGNLFDVMRPDDVRTLIENIHSKGMQCAIAGSVGVNDLGQLVELDPDIVAVRGSVCRQGDRRQTICPERVKALSRSFRNIARPARSRVY